MGGRFWFHYINVYQNYMQFPERCNQSQEPFGCSEMAIKKGIVQIHKDGMSSKTAIFFGGEGGKNRYVIMLN